MLLRRILWFPILLLPQNSSAERKGDKDARNLKITFNEMITLYTIASELHRGLPEVRDDAFIRSVEKAVGQSFAYGDDFREFVPEKDLIFVRTGGTEGIFKALGLKGPIRLLTSGKDNSLAAAMEILAYINANGGRGEILHGTPEYIAQRLQELGDACGDGACGGKALGAGAFIGSGAGKWLKPLPELDFGGARLGIIGKPSDWLIASDVDYAKAKAKLNLELVDIDIDELIRDVKSRKDVDLRSFKGSEAIYDALKGIVARYRLSGLTIRCFDLLDTLGNTGCLALARLNAEGIPSSCEGDVPALITMMIASKMYGCPGFQCNLSRISGDQLLFAHCTVPLSMVRSFSYDTHFESGIGTAIKGEIPEGPVVIMKVAPDLSCMAAIEATILRNQSEPGLCRTQIIVSAPGAAPYFLTAPLANHHIVVPNTLIDAPPPM